MIRKLLILFSLAMLIASPVYAEKETSIFDSLVNKISTLKKSLDRDSIKRQKLQKELEKTEIGAGKIGKKLHETTHQLRKQKTLLHHLQRHEATYTQKLNEQEKILERQIVTAYMLGRQSYLKLLLNQENSAKVSRVLMYYHYLNENRIQAIINTQKTLQKIQSNQKQLQLEYDKLKQLHQQEQHQRHTLEKAKAQREKLITALDESITSRKQRLTILVANEARLKKTIAHIRHRRAKKFPKANLGKMRYSLHWPARGKVHQIFGTKVQGSELRWGGVLISAHEGTPVYAIAKGKVVFAKWLSGYGLLLIINHGNGYMTLYGRNHMLYKNVGDTVHRHDLIATVGQTGGYKKPALYFAVRHDGVPVNPALFIGR
ncbi:MAG: peptidoglycan DD-metalloendopeptidase family protein [Coxiellaceae bacterium]|nr:peptidoglycan DD-metalloendopeptidase family protein [Coxiellaceae bacterium]